MANGRIPRVVSLAQMIHLYFLAAAGSGVVAWAFAVGGLGWSVPGWLLAVMVRGWRGLRRAWPPLVCMVSRLC